MDIAPVVLFSLKLKPSPSTRTIVRIAFVSTVTALSEITGCNRRDRSRDCELLVRDFMACICPERVLLEQEVDVEVILRTPRGARSTAGMVTGWWTRLGLLRRYIRLFIREGSFVNDFAVLQKFPLDFIGVDIGKVVLIIDVDLAVHELVFRSFDPNGLVLILHS